MTDPRLELPRPAPGAGTYRYLLNGEVTPVTEEFEVPTDPAEAIRSVRRAPGGVELSVVAEPNGADDADVLVTFHSDSVSEVTARYVLADGRLTVHLHDSTGATSTKEMEAADGVLSPLLRVFQGPTIAHAIRLGGQCVVALPDITDPEDPARLLQPVMEMRRADRLGVETGTGTVLRHCSYVGGNYDDDAGFWLDERDRLVRYRFPQGPEQLWEVELDES